MPAKQAGRHGMDADTTDTSYYFNYLGYHGNAAPYFVVWLWRRAALPGLWTTFRMRRICVKKIKTTPPTGRN